MKTLSLIAALLCTLGLCAQTPSGLSKGEFSKYWTVESESPEYSLRHLGDTIEIVSPKGLTLWRKAKVKGDVVIEYDACVVDEGAPTDRLSDLNCFWMASDPKHPDNIMRRASWRQGIFTRCYTLQMYYLGYGGNYNSTTRFRRYDGNEAAVDSAALRPAILTEYTDPDHLLKPNKWYHIRITNHSGRVTYEIDGERIVDFRDANPLSEGWFGFRTTLSRTRIANYKQTPIVTDEDAPVTVRWIGGTPAQPTPNTWGVPFRQGKVNASDRFALTADGREIDTYDFAPLAYWPDGSVKWGAFSALIPPTDSLTVTKLTKVSKKANRPISDGTRAVVPPGLTSMTATTPAAITVSTGAINAYISTSGSNIIDSICTADGKRSSGAIDLVCLTETPTPTGYDIGRYTSRIDKSEVENDGAAHAVVKLQGYHTDGHRQWLPVTVRLYFYKGSDQVKVVHSFVFDGDQDTDFIRGLGVRMSTPMHDREMYNRHVAFSTADGGVWSEPVQPLVGRRTLKLDGKDVQPAQMRGERIPAPEAFDQLGQSLIANWAQWDGFRLSQTTPDGYTIRKRATDDSPWIGTLTGSRASGVAYAGGTEGGMAIALLDFWQSYPSTLQIDGARTSDATVTAWLWSPESEAMDLRHYDKVAHDLDASYEDVQEGLSTPYGIARTSVLMLKPYTYRGKEDFAALAAGLSTEPQLCCTPQYLHDVRAFGVWSLPDRSTQWRAGVEDRLQQYITLYKHCVEEHKWYGFWDYGDFMHAYDPIRHEWRYDVGGYAWDNTELASNMWLWYSFLRSADPETWTLAKAMGRHTAEVDVYHIGDNAGLGSRHNVSHWGCGAKEARISQAAWNRFYYYLTADERTGDLMTEVKDADLKLYTLDPMRLARPRSEYPCTAPARLRVGPDWLAYAGNWMTQWERTGDTYYRDKIAAGMRSIAALPKGLFTGPKVLGYDPATGIVSYEGDPQIEETNHLLSIMGGFEIVNEMNEMLPIPEWQQAWLDHAATYRDHPGNKFPLPRLAAYGAYHLADPTLRERAWSELLGKSYPDSLPPMDMYTVQRPEVTDPLMECPTISTNDAATWSLDAIYMMETCPR